MKCYDNCNSIKRETDEAEIKVIMIAQRVREAESRIVPRLSNGPLRVQSKAGTAEYSATWRHTSVVRDMIVSYGVCEVILRESRWHRE